MGGLKRVALLLALSVASLAANRAEALPAFSRKTGMACPACHDAWPRLNDFGELYRDRGYRIGNTDDDVFAHPLDYFPISFRATPGYQFSSMTHQATDSGDTTVGTGAFVFPAADVYLGMALANHVSAYVDIAGFSKDGTASLESAWVRLNDLGTSWLNLKLGRLELDLPFSMHRAHTIFAPFLIYGYHPTASINGFNLDENQLAIELMGHGDGTGLRYSIVFATNADAGAAAVFSAPLMYGHVTYTALFDSLILPRLRVGGFGDAGSWPTTFKTLTPMGGAPAPVSGTGGNPGVHSHVGGDLQLAFVSLAHPLTLTAVWMFGSEDSALIPNATRDAHFHGGFVQVDYTPILPLTFGARYDGVYNTQQADPTQPADSNDQLGFTFFLRYALWISTWGSVVSHTEVSTVETQNAAMVPINPVRNTFVFTGFDFLL
jgi:hypothetical protein